jgi:nucleoside-diphosphate-sugar epimerase
MRLVKDVLNYEPRVSLLDGISRTWQWYRDYVFEAEEPSAQ